MPPPDPDLNALFDEAAKRKKVAEFVLDLQHGSGQKSSAADAMQTMAERGEGPAPVFGEHAAFGLLKGLTGIPQAALDLGSHLPSPVGDASARASKYLTDRVNQIGKTVPPGGTASSIGEGVAEMLPGVIGTGGGGLIRSAVGGALTGATQFQQAPSEQDRETARGIGAATGGVVGAAGDIIGQGINKVINSKEINRVFKRIQEDFTSADPSVIPNKTPVTAALERSQKAWAQKNEAFIKAADAQGPIMMDTSGTAQKISDLAEDTGKMVNPDPKAVKILDNISDLYAPTRGLPNKISVSGRDFFLDPTGQYVTKQGGQALPPAVQKAALDALGVKPNPGVPYSQVKRTVEEIDQFLEDVKPNAATKNLKAVRDLLEERLNTSLTPSLKRQQAAAQRFYEKNLAEFDKPEIKDIIASTDPLERVNKVTKIATGDNPKLAQTVADLVGPEAQRGVRGQLVKKALDDALDEKTGQIDAVKFAKFFEGDGKSAMEPFFDSHTKMQIGGIKNLLREDALHHGESSAPSLSHPSGSFGLGLGMVEMARGQFVHGATMMTAAALTGPTFAMLNRMLQSSFGRNLLVAANRAVPGSPRMAKLSQAMTQRFGAVAGAEAGQAAGAP